MKIVNTTIELQTKGEFDFIDLTDKVKAFIKESQIKNGLVNIQTLHTTAVLIINENEPLLLEDFKRHLENLSPKTLKYNHDDFKKRTVNLCADECINGHSHCKAILLSVNVSLNLIKGEIQFGQWQRILLVELDRTRKRKIQIQILGE
ncbi:secondary thiamine-phosphate synthase enzyme [bacterium (Candidatus Gribaldobacteria) CG07_land_8_20_14_0_80_33_18]|uniref:Secondary thiamine-phosphate synthase enzyme n=1 Tax=bacterium (Candidatus Gribaldobacteria) CG07_land_8_20_14_0_80_33_18 TaxID=2014272 RepID=A0A2M6Z3B8_9BACT|nr:MAG: secondary thiamine-phosphate synthase enzyme [bacterium (Candidatus Gribaldobacteria) CG07_land_8_20_14_0_80_33_18]PJA01056.1 MAG: secondary thiamine-phosphate synthase enzyme [bacterium (Candidatus Gribaldobacteria) CG_4_10_14_0_2_um_filter_33_15]PJB08638.1 MAG: secondary thiamine-phosphate synthase enzyme [bacterium (Candidatus Gribaldobacteria) CG_4_9_14_3_um_filter_33_9]